MRTIDVFFYGLFMDEELLGGKGVRVVSAKRASLPGFGLKIGKRATLVPNRSGRVFGIVASLSHADLDHLYSDPSVRAYRPEAVLVHLEDGEALPALCFNLVEPPSSQERNPEYASKLRALAQRLQLPAEYVDSIA